MVKDVADVAHLMGRNEHHLVVGHSSADEFAELTLAGDVKTIGGLIHNQGVGVGSEGESHEHLLFLAHRQGVQLGVHVTTHVEDVQITLHVLHAEAGIERRVDSYIFLEAQSWQFKLLGNQENVAHRLGQTAANVLTVHQDFTVLGSEQSRHQVDEGGLTSAVLAQKAVNVAGL